MSDHKDRKPNKPGTVYHPESGKLVKMDVNFVEVIRSWPSPQAWRKVEDGPFKNCHVRLLIPAKDLERRADLLREKLERQPSDAPGEQHPLFPETTLPNGFFELNRDLLQTQWLARIPQNVRDAIRKFRCEQWHLLRLAWACEKEALEMMESTPALALMLACSQRYNKVTWQLRSLRSLLLKPGKNQAEIAGWLGFPARPATIRLLRKMHSSALDPKVLLYLRQVLSNPHIFKRLAHLPELNRNVIRIVTDVRLEPMVSDRLLQELSNTRLNGKHAWHAYQLLDIWQMRQAADLGGCPHVIHRIESIDQEHDDLVRAIGGMNLASPQLIDRCSVAFPDPPLQGNEVIQAITDVSDLQEEGREQCNCVLSYHKGILDGSTYIYRVLSPERGTLSLVRRGSNWTLGELAAFRNSKPSSLAMKAVWDWFNARTDCNGNARQLMEMGKGLPWNEDDWRTGNAPDLPF